MKHWAFVMYQAYAALLNFRMDLDPGIFILYISLCNYSVVSTWRAGMVWKKVQSWKLVRSEVWS